MMMHREAKTQPGAFLRHTFRFPAILPALAAALLAGGCQDLFVPDFNNPNLDCAAGGTGQVCNLPANPTRGQIANAAVGLLISARVDYGDYVRDIGIIGREAFDLDEADPRFVTELLGPQLDPGSRAFGGDHWLEPYITIRNANILVNALDRIPTTPTPTPTSLTAEEKEAVQGFAKTIQALEFLPVINTRDTRGAVIDTDRPIGDFGAIVSKEAVFDHIATLLDEALGHLQAAGENFPFRLTSGFAGFDTPQTFVPFNRALKARVEILRLNFAQALTALNESFIVDCSSFDLGVYHTYSTAAGDLPNPIFEDPADADLRAHPALEILAQRQASGELDLRFLGKTFETTVKEQLDHASDRTFTIYESTVSPIPIIRNEELLLLRAEANIGLGNLEVAEADINCIREQVGGLEPVELTAANALDELLYNKTFSLLLEGGHRWVDFRRYDRTDQLPIDVPGDFVHLNYPIPRDEELPRE